MISIFTQPILYLVLFIVFFISAIILGIKSWDHPELGNLAFSILILSILFILILALVAILTN